MGYLSDQNWITYVDRTYQQIKTRVLTSLGVLVPEITDHTESNPYVKTLGIWAGIAEMLGYYIDTAGREAFIGTCRLYKSAIQHARAFDYRVHANVAATVDVTFTVSMPSITAIVIPAGTRVSTGTVEFRTIANVTISIAQLSATVGARQYIHINEFQIGLTNGTPGQEVPIAPDIVDGSAIIKLIGIIYEAKDTLAYSNSTDKHYVQTVNQDGFIVAKFGDGYNGYLPPAGIAVRASYNATVSETGNVAAGEINVVNSAVTLPPGITLKVTNAAKATNGKGVETLEELKRRIPASIRTLNRAVTRQDYIDMAESVMGVARAGIIFECGKALAIYIVPDGGGIASSVLLGDVAAYLDKRKMITTQITVLTAGEIIVLLTINLKVKENYPRITAVNDVTVRVVDYMSYQNQEIGGIFRIGDLYQVIEQTEGVESSAITAFVPLPYAIPQTGAPVLDWTRTLKPASIVNIEWKIIMVSTTDFQLYRNNVIVGTFTAGTPVVTDEVDLTLNGVYTTGDTWTFVTYPYNAVLVELEEPSVLVSRIEAITINATGGI